MNKINVIVQGFYGNRTSTSVKREDIDPLIRGYDSFFEEKRADRTIIPIPNMEDIVIVYNKYQEEEVLEYKEKVFKNENYILKPLVVIPENGIELYSRCIVCRVNNGEIESLRNGDYEKFVKYLAE